MDYGELGWQEAVILGCAKRQGLLEAVANGSRSRDTHLILARRSG
jgi:hypothetical protein